MSKTTYSWSHDEETYTGDFDTREDAMNEGFATDYGDALPGTVWTGVNVPPPVRSWAEDTRHAEHLIESMRDDAADNEMPECCEDWLSDVPKPALKELSTRIADVFMDWLTQTMNEPRFYTVAKVVQHDKATCTTCDGDGSVTLDEATGDTEECEDCNGRGRR